MGSDSSGGSAARIDEARTDPFLPRITDEMLAARQPAVPVLDDHSLAHMLAELDGEPSPSPIPTQRGEPSRAALPAVSPAPQPRAVPEDEPRTYGPDDDPSVLLDGADGPVLRSRYGDFRPPIPIGRRRRRGEDDWYLPDAPSLTGLGLTRRSWSRTGSRLFTWLFIAIFALIFLQFVIGVVSSAANP